MNNIENLLSVRDKLRTNLKSKNILKVEAYSDKLIYIDIGFNQMVFALDVMPDNKIFLVFRNEKAHQAFSAIWGYAFQWRTEVFNGKEILLDTLAHSLTHSLTHSLKIVILLLQLLLY